MDEGQFGIGVGEAEPGDAVAHGETGDAFTDGGDGACYLAAERDGLGALAHLSYGRQRDTDRFGTDEQLTRPGYRNGGLLGEENLGATADLIANTTHGHLRV